MLSSKPTYVQEQSSSISFGARRVVHLSSAQADGECSLIAGAMPIAGIRCAL